MSSLIRFPKLNPVFFPPTTWKDTLPDFYKASEYYQIWEKDDVIRFAFEIDSTIVDANISQVKLMKLGDVVEEIANFQTISIWYSGSGNSILNITCHLSLGPLQLDEGYYCIKVGIYDMYNQVWHYIYSETMDIRTTHSNSTKIVYSNSGIEHDVYFLYQNGGMIAYYFRLHGGFKPDEYQPGNFSNVYNDQIRSAVALSGYAWDIQKLTCGNNKGIPNYVHQLLNRIIFDCDYLKIDGVKYSRFDGSSWEQSDKQRHFGKSVWKIDLVESPNTESLEYPVENIVIGNGEMGNEKSSFVYSDIVDGVLTMTSVDAIPYPAQAIVEVFPDAGNSYTLIFDVTKVDDHNHTIQIDGLPSGTYQYNLLYLE